MTHAYEYSPTSQIFASDPSSYPQLHLPVAHFIGEDSKAHAEPFEGPSNLANLLLRCAVDASNIENNKLHESLTKRRLWLTGTFLKALGSLDLHVDLQLHGDTTYMRAGQNHDQTAVCWIETGEHPIVKSVRYEDAAVFRYTGDEQPAPLEHVTYNERIRNTTYAHSPALRIGAEFSNFERWALDRVARAGVEKAVRLELIESHRL